jgi:hypothetical protein
MRRVIIAIIALAIINPAVAGAAPPAGRISAAAPVGITKKSERSARLRKKVKKARAKAKPAVPDAPPGGSEAALQGKSAAPICATPQKGEVARRCLRLAQPAPLPMPASASVSMRPGNPAIAPYAAPSRTWLGAVSKRVVVELVGLAEHLSRDETDWRMTMAEEIQWELQHARLKEIEKIKQAERAIMPSRPRNQRMAGLERPLPRR